MMIEEREKEITAIVQSISEINEMYRDLAALVVDQVGKTQLCSKCVVVVLCTSYKIVAL